MNTLTERTTYIRSDGRRVHIAGHARTESLDGQRVWWSIEGDHYLDDGRMIGGRIIYRGAGEPLGYERFVTERRLLPESADTSDAWWIGVKT